MKNLLHVTPSEVRFSGFEKLVGNTVLSLLDRTISFYPLAPELRTSPNLIAFEMPENRILKSALLAQEIRNHLELPEEGEVTLEFYDAINSYTYIPSLDPLHIRETAAK